VLAFGRLSVLEACCTAEGIKVLEEACDRVCVVETGSPLRSLTKLAGIHKFAPVLAQFDGEEERVGDFAKAIASEFDVRKFALSGYDVPDADYEELVRMLLDAFREEGIKKVRLLRPKGNELLAEQVVTREALDIIAFPRRGGYALGATTWVSDAPAIRRATTKPAPSPEISMSPRLARTLINISALTPGKTLLDPFCGSGTILAAGLARSLVCIGVDSDSRRIRDARRNLEWAKRGSRGHYVLKVGDATDLPAFLRDTRADGVVTEPILLPKLNSRPNASVAAELMAVAGETYARSLPSIVDVLNPGGRIVMVAPVLLTVDGGEVSMDLNARQLGLRQVQPGPIGFKYPVRLSFESTRWVRRSVYVFEWRP